MNTQITTDEKNWAMGAHLSAFSGVIIPFGNLIGPLVVWLVKKNESEFINQHGKAALNFQISFTIYLLLIVAMFLFNLFKSIPELDALGNNPVPGDVFSALGRWMFWILPMVFIAFFKLIVVIIAAIRAGEGKLYKYPLTIPFVG